MEGTNSCSQGVTCVICKAIGSSSLCLKTQGRLSGLSLLSGLKWVLFCFVLFYKRVFLRLVLGTHFVDIRLTSNPGIHLSLPPESWD